MSAITWAIALVFLGVGLYILLPIALARRRSQNIANHYLGMALLVMDRALLIARKHGGYSLVPSSYDSTDESESVTLDGETLHFEDPYEFTTSLFNKRFGLADEERNVIINPRLAELGKRYFDFYHEGEHEIPVTVDGQDTTAFSSVFVVPERPTMVNPREARWMIPGSASPKLFESVKDDVEKSQLMYKERNYVDLMIGLFAFAIGFGLPVLSAWLGVTPGGTPEVPGVDFNLFLGWWL